MNESQKIIALLEYSSSTFARSKGKGDLRKQKKVHDTLFERGWEPVEKWEKDDSQHYTHAKFPNHKIYIDDGIIHHDGEKENYVDFNKTQSYLNKLHKVAGIAKYAWDQD